MKENAEEIDRLLREMVESEAGKDRVLGTLHKQHLTNVQIHEKVSRAEYGKGLGVGKTDKKAKEKSNDIEL